MPAVVNSPFAASRPTSVLPDSRLKWPKPVGLGSARSGVSAADSLNRADKVWMRLERMAIAVPRRRAIDCSVDDVVGFGTAAWSRQFLCSYGCQVKAL